MASTGTVMKKIKSAAKKMLYLFFPVPVLITVAFIALFLTILAPSVCGAAASARRHAQQTNDTVFVLTNRLRDGERETRIRYGNIYAKETSIGSDIEHTLKLRQLTDGHHFIQMIYDSSGLKDCEFGRDPHEITAFIQTFRSDIYDLLRRSPIGGGNDSVNSDVTSSHLAANESVVVGAERINVDNDEHGWFHYESLRDLCRKRHRQLKRRMKLQLQRQQRNVTLTESSDDVWENNGISGARRGKRDLSDLLRVPGTKWCGKGYSATKYTQLGGISRTDKCCRMHDTRCPFWIGGFDTKYGLFNWRVNTLMHCACDERFRACLRMVGSGDANFVGKLFFNVVQTKCFVLKPKKICRKRTWWGKCLKIKIIKKAVLRNNLKYK